MPPAEVWGRMVRNLANCHSQGGELAQARLAQQLLMPLTAGDHSRLALEVPCPSGGRAEGAGGAQPPAGPGQPPGAQQLMQMLQSLLQMAPTGSAPPSA